MFVTVENMDTPFGSSERFAIQDEEGCRQWFHEEADEVLNLCLESASELHFHPCCINFWTK